MNVLVTGGTGLVGQAFKKIQTVVDICWFEGC